MSDKKDTNNKGYNKGWDNLVPIKPGEVRNPMGRPKKEFSITNAMKELLSEPDPKTKIERYKKILLVAIEKAENGDNDMIKYLVNRLEGVPRGEGGIVAIQNNFYELTPEQELEEALVVLGERSGKSVEEIRLWAKL